MNTNRSKVYSKKMDSELIRILYEVLRLLPPIFLDSSMVEHSAVNRVVVGSSPTRGANIKLIISILYVIINQSLNSGVGFQLVWLRGQAVKTSPFHGGNTGSIPVGVICLYGNT